MIGGPIGASGSDFQGVMSVLDFVTTVMKDEGKAAEVLADLNARLADLKAREQEVIDKEAEIKGKLDLIQAKSKDLQADIDRSRQTEASAQSALSKLSEERSAFDVRSKNVAAEEKALSEQKREFERHVQVQTDLLKKEAEKNKTFLDQRQRQLDAALKAAEERERSAKEREAAYNARMTQLKQIVE